MEVVIMGVVIMEVVIIGVVIMAVVITVVVRLQVRLLLAEYSAVFLPIIDTDTQQPFIGQLM